MRIAESFFQFKTYVIKHFSFYQNPSKLKTNSKLLYSIEEFEPVVKSIQKSKNSFIGKVQLSLVIHGKNSPEDKRPTRKVEIVIVGEFEGKDISDKDFEKFCLISGVLQLLSIARAYIASATAATGAPSIIMPLINLPATLKEQIQ